MGFIDEATGRSDVFYMHAKTDAVNARRQWESNTMHIGPTKRYRADNGSEFIDQKFRDDIIASGSSIEFTAPYTHHTLLMERLWRTTVTLARANLKGANMPKAFWAYALSAAFLPPLRNLWTAQRVPIRTH
jgi:hypothetical protein